MHSEDESKAQSSQISAILDDLHLSIEQLNDISTTLESRYKERAQGSGHQP